jgi:hypothetical protein
MQDHEEEQKKPYEKPEAKRFPLRPEEAVLGFCKSPSGTGQNAPSGCRPVGACLSQGS